MRILLSEGSGLTSRQTAWRLDDLGHEVELLSSSKLCLSRFTRHVRAVHITPDFGSDPLGWLDAALDIATRRRADLLFPTHEQVTVLSAQEARLPVPTLAPAFSALRRLQDKASAYRTLAEIGAPQPPTLFVSSPSDLERVDTFPVFLKRPISTASSGVRRACTAQEVQAAARDLGLGRGELIVQAQIVGPLAMVQAVADHGRLIALHANLRVKEGIGGGAAIKRSIVLPGLREALERIVSALEWRGGLSMDVILGEDGWSIIDVNPRLVEPMNAYFAGVDLVAAMLDLIGGAAQARPEGRPDVLSHQSLLSILGVAAQVGSRRAIWREAVDLFWSRGAYAGSQEELTPTRGDPLAAAPILAALAATTLYPPLWRKFHSGAVERYAVTPQSWEKIVASALS